MVSLACWMQNSKDVKEVDGGGRGQRKLRSIRLLCGWHAPGEVRALRFFGYGIPTIQAVLTAVAAGIIASDAEGMWLPGDVLLCLDVIMGMISTSGSELYGADADALVAMVISQLLVH